MENIKMWDVALNIVKNTFGNRLDKGGKPYVEHLIRVADNSITYLKPPFDIGDKNRFERVKAIGLLHDLIEDYPETWTLNHIDLIFNDRDLTNAIELLTRDDSKYNYQEYVVEISKNEYATAVKLADLKDNMDLTRINKITQEDIDRIKKYHMAYYYLLEKFELSWRNEI